jgi:hypothetical protein
MMTVRGKHDYGNLYSQYMTQINKAQYPHQLDEVLDAILTFEKTKR